MRPPHEIRREIIRIRDKNKLAMTVIAERARVSRSEVLSCLSMHASEDTLRKLDAFLDVPDLHRRPRSQTLICYDMERLGREAYRQFKLRTVHPNTFALWPSDRQKRYYNSITARAKFMLQKKVIAENGIVVKVPDGATYWQYKERCFHRIRGEEALRTGDRDSRRVPWTRPVREEQPL